MSPEQLNQLIASRRAVYPAAYSDRAIPREIIEQILENANWAPTHKRTEPWRFRVFSGDGRQKLSDYLESHYREHTPPDVFSEKKLEKTLAKPLQSACVIAICMRRDPAERLPEWEELAAVACAVQNMWLSCTAYGIGSYWSTPASAADAAGFLGLEKGERCLGWFYMGYPEIPPVPGRRGEISAKVKWL